jgi:hypothetical protein
MGSLIHQLWLYMRTRKKFWLLPTLIMAAVVGAFVTVTNSLLESERLREINLPGGPAWP